MDLNPKLSAAIILIREQQSGTFKTLLLERNSKISYGSSYAFPGGTIEESDLSSKNPKINACLRELQEETNLQINDEDIFPFFRMVTPAILNIKRHDNQFYLKFLKDDQSLDQIIIDKNENITYRWDYPINFINDFLNKTIMVTPPVYYLLFTLIKQNTMPNLVKYYQSLNKESLIFPIIFDYFKDELNNQGDNQYYCYGDYRYNIEKIIRIEQNNYLAKELEKKYRNMQKTKQLYFEFKEYYDKQGRLNIKCKISKEFINEPFGIFGNNYIIKDNKLCANEQPNL